MGHEAPEDELLAAKGLKGGMQIGAGKSVRQALGDNRLTVLRGYLRRDLTALGLEVEGTARLPLCSTNCRGKSDLRADDGGLARRDDHRQATIHPMPA